MKFKSLGHAEKIRPECPGCKTGFGWFENLSFPIEFEINEGDCKPAKKFVNQFFHFKCEDKDTENNGHVYQLNFKVRINLKSFKITSIELLSERLWDKPQGKFILRVDTNFKQNSIVRRVPRENPYDEGVSLTLAPLKELNVSNLLARINKVATLK
jgi:hypothetical protein